MVTGWSGTSASAQHLVGNGAPATWHALVGDPAYRLAYFDDPATASCPALPSSWVHASALQMTARWEATISINLGDPAPAEASEAVRAAIPNGKTGRSLPSLTASVKPAALAHRDVAVELLRGAETPARGAARRAGRGMGHGPVLAARQGRGRTDPTNLRAARDGPSKLVASGC